MREKILIPLIHLELESGCSLKLNDSEEIIKSSDLDNGISIPFNPIPKFFFLGLTRDGERPRRALDRILILFKLYRDNLVLSNIILNEKGQIIDQLPHYTYWKDVDRKLSNYLISKKEEQDFKSFWNKYTKINYFNFALNRFHIADYNVYSEFRLINYVECLEFLFVPDSSSGEISYKFKIRGTKILGESKTQSEKENILMNLKNLYNLRSSIVHGNTKKKIKLKSDKKWEDFLVILRDYCRESIKFIFEFGCLDDSSKRKDILEKMVVFGSKTNLKNDV